MFMVVISSLFAEYLIHSARNVTTISTIAVPVIIAAMLDVAAESSDETRYILHSWTVRSVRAVYEMQEL